MRIHLLVCDFIMIAAGTYCYYRNFRQPNKKKVTILSAVVILLGWVLVAIHIWSPYTFGVINPWR